MGIERDKKRIALTIGDPAGIGPEIAVKTALDPLFANYADIILYGSSDIINAALEFAECADSSLKPLINPVGSLKFREITPGVADGECGIEARNAIITAVQDALKGEVDAVVTAPMNKASVNLAGIPFTGHTELIAELCNVPEGDFAMMQSAADVIMDNGISENDNSDSTASFDLRVVFATTHIPLSKVSETLTQKRILKVAALLHDVIVTETGRANPLLAVAALNPHAGEAGFMGSEEENILKPAIRILQNDGMNIQGPFPPDTLFIGKTLSQFDGIISIYHDQGHIPFKMLAFDKGVNSTLGLPIIRTSVDHGTAFDIAWREHADTGSLKAAIKLALNRILADSN